MKKHIDVLELFAGVGGFRLGLESNNSDFFVTKYANQWEPSRKVQIAFDIYNRHFTNSVNLNQDITKITDVEFKKMKVDMIVGGFPCQDYSVARSISNEKGIEGKKGVLFWEIKRAIENINPKYLLLENVDRLLKSPAKQRGRDFAIMLKTFDDLGYNVQWRVINAADYGMPQRRRRVFIWAYKRQTWDKKKNIFDLAFEVEKIAKKEADFKLVSDILDISDNFSADFLNSGEMTDGEIKTRQIIPIKRKEVPLKTILEPEEYIDENKYISGERLEKFKYLRDSKKVPRKDINGFEYLYSEGAMSEHDNLDKPGRTMLTSEGTTNRSTHLLKIDGKYRLLMPIEAERLNMFPDNWTEGATDNQRFFLMGNALVTGIVSELAKIIETSLKG